MFNSSPTKETLPLPRHMLSSPSLDTPPSPRTHRLRRLQSAHSLGQSYQPSLISQQHKVLQRSHSPTRNSLHTRGRSNSDATSIPIMATSRRPMAVTRRSIAADALSLDRLVREGPPDGDVTGALESIRLKILDSGIKSDSDGMASNSLSHVLF